MNGRIRLIKGHGGKSFGTPKLFFFAKKYVIIGKNQFEAGHCSPTAQRWLVCAKSFDRVKLEFSSTFFKRWWVSKGQSPLTPSAEGGTLLSSGAFEEVWNPFAREKGSKNGLQVQTIPEKFPVGSFRQ